MIDRDPIDGLIADTHATVSRDCAAVPPDFAAVVARAKLFAGEEAPTRFDARIDDDDGDESVVDIRSRARATESSSGLDVLIGDARVSLERIVEGQGMRAIPPLPTVTPQRSRWNRRPLALVAGAVGLAAAAVVAFTLVRSDSASLAEPTAPLDQAFRIEADEVTGGEVIEEHEDPVVLRHRGPAPILEPAPVIATPPIAVTPVRTPTPRVQPDRLRSLSEEARRLWRAGNRIGAEAKFLEVTAAGGRTALAELAWGDLFALADQLGDDAKSAKRWRAYLGKFPRGRYADDARAGLCRSAAAAAACWTKYLHDFPEGSYRAEARAAAPTEGGR